jgi:hypothetical protein
MSRAALLAVLLAALAQAQGTISVALERQEGAAWKAIDPRTVLDSGAAIRFKVKAEPGGYLYVFYRGGAGEAAWLFPAQESGVDNRLDAGREYVVPARGSFTVDGPPGFDITYWLLTPEALPSGLPEIGPAPRGSDPRELKPRCREVLEKAPCRDERAGAGPVSGAAALLPALKPGAALRPRGIRFSEGKQETQVRTGGGAPVLYEFRVAHR